jgi:hypothetical protein
VNPLVSRCCARNKIGGNGVNMKRERLAQIVLVIVGLLNLPIIYFLYKDLRPGLASLLDLLFCFPAMACSSASARLIPRFS